MTWLVMLAGQAGSWQIFKLMQGIVLYSDICEMPWGQNLPLTLQIAAVEAAA